ncbi:MAG: protein-L-isoaspartate(D-aspartate) O-methyltransferase [Elusimicrobiota bacterium]|nr:protein-L-isoaspartate(D-aspartate) O-methyltransferase [Elusimicrobiota bacterium]
MRQKDFDVLRTEMVETQIIQRGITDTNVVKAMLKVPRHLFVPKEYINQAYDDHPLPIGEGQTVSQPYMVALMTELLALSSTEKVLEIGTGSGYQTALLAELSKEVYTVERIKVLIDRAKKLLDLLNYKNIFYKVGDGTEGWEESAPYDRIIVTAGSADMPEPLIEQLKENGKVVIPIGDRFSQVLCVFEKKDGKLKKREICGCVFVPLIGKFGWKK